jgi:hypothetical protein
MRHLEGRTGAAGRRYQPLLVAQNDFAVGADIDEQGDGDDWPHRFSGWRLSYIRLAECGICVFYIPYRRLHLR